MENKKYLVYSSVGDNRKVNFWTNPDRIYDVCVVYYGDSEFPDTAGIDYFLKNKDFKITNFLKCVKNYEKLHDYDYYLFIDDDLIIDQYTIEETLKAAERYSLDLCQPSIKIGSAYSWPFLLTQKNVYIQFTNFAEIQCFCISKKLLQKVLPFFGIIKSGYGLDLLISEMLDGKKDAIAVLHYLNYEHLDKPYEEKVMAKIANFEDERSRIERALQFSLGLSRKGQLSSESCVFKVYRTIFTPEAGLMTKVKTLAINPYQQLKKIKTQTLRLLGEIFGKIK